MANVNGDSGNNDLLGTNGDDQISGFGGNDTLVGAAGNDALNGGAGNDALVGAAGNDTLNGGAGTDSLLYYRGTGTQGANVNLQTGRAVDTWGNIDTLIGIERVYGSHFADTITGANAGADFLFGRGGNDVLSGGGGDDTLVGDQGSDTLRGGDGDDQVAYFLEAGTQGVTVNLQTGTATDTFGATDTLASIERIYGSHFADTIIGANFSADFLFGEDGNDNLNGGDMEDTLVGGAGADTLRGGAGEDQVAYSLESGGGGVTVDLLAGTATDSYGQTDTLVSIERVFGTDERDTLLGTNIDGDRLFGGGGDDYIDGRDGKNLIYTGDGNDTIRVGTTLEDARDTVVIDGYGSKTVIGTGAEGSRYAHHLVFDITEAVTVNLATGIATSASMSLNFSEALHFLEVGGTALDDHLIGGNSAHDYLEWFSGNQGNDTMNGGSGYGDTVVYDDEVLYGAPDPVTGERVYGFQGAVVNLQTGVATDTFGDTDTLINIDQVRATRFVDVVTGSDEDNGFWMLAGNDTVNGGAGIDRVHYGEDYLTGGTAGVTVNLVTGTAIDGFGDTDTLISIEWVHASDYADSVLGDGGANRIFGYAANDTLTGGAGEDTLNGGEGNDRLIAGTGGDELWGEAGNDTIDGGSGDDTVRYGDDTAGATIDLAGGRATDGWGGSDTLIGIENAFGSEFGDRITGSTAGNRLGGAGGADYIFGGNGEDTVLGGDGNDTLQGGAQDDELWGEAGNDVLNGGAGADVVRYREDPGAVTVNLGSGTARDGWGGTDTLSGIEHVHGSEHGDSLLGDGAGNRLFGYGGNDTLNGAGGGDTLLGGDGNDQILGGEGDDEIWGEAGNDTLNGRGGSDLVRYQTAQSGIILDLAAGTARDGYGFTDTLIDIENVHGSEFADVISGNSAANRLFGFAGSDRFDGGAGDDTILGGDGNDLLRGSAGDDVLWGEAGNDTLSGGSGSDLVRYREVTSGVSVDLARGLTSDDGQGGHDELTSIEQVHGSDYGDLLRGSSADNILSGFDGADTLSGGAGQDVLIGGGGGDRYEVSAGDGFTTINDVGGTGSDRLVIADYLAQDASIYLQSSGSSNIVLHFGPTRDVIVLVNGLSASAAGAIETIEFGDGTVWNHATLVANIGQVGVTRQNSSGSGSDTLIGTSADDRLAGQGGNDVLHGLAGNDTLSGGSGNDTLRAGAGNDSVDAGAGNDLIAVGAGNDTVDGGGGYDVIAFDTVYQGGGSVSWDAARGVLEYGNSVFTNVELLRFLDREFTPAELVDAMRNAVPVSTLSSEMSSSEGALRIDLNQYFTDPEGQSLTFWAENLPEGLSLNGSVISGTTEAAYTPYPVTIGVSDGSNSLSVEVSWTITNDNTLPTGALTLEGDSGIGDTLGFVSTVADADGIDPASVSYQWLRDGAAISGAIGTSYTLTEADDGHRISLSMSFTDLYGAVESVTSDQSDVVRPTHLHLTGTDANETLVGDIGNDTLRGMDGADTLIGNEGDDFLFGGASPDDRRDVIYGGAGHDSIEGGYGNDELRGDAGNDTIAGGFGGDTVIGGDGNDTLTGAALGDEIYGGAGGDFVNGGFGHDRVNGGGGADRFYHLGIFDHGSDWVQDYSAAEGDMLVFGQDATEDQFQVNYTQTAGAGAAGVDEAFVIYRPTGQIMWALIDGAGEDSIMLSLGGELYDLVA